MQIYDVKIQSLFLNSLFTVYIADEVQNTVEKLNSKHCCFCQNMSSKLFQAFRVRTERQQLLFHIYTSENKRLKSILSGRKTQPADWGLTEFYKVD